MYEIEDSDYFRPFLDFTSSEYCSIIDEKKMDIKINDNIYNTSLKVALDISRNPLIIFEGELQEIDTHSLLKFLEDNQMSILYNQDWLDGIVIKATTSIGKNNISFTWTPKKQPVFALGDNSTKVEKLIFHIFNFVDYISETYSIEEKESSVKRINNITFYDDAWKIEIKSLFDTSDNIISSKKDGKFRLTHLGCIKKQDNSLFGLDESMDILFRLKYFLSFIKGNWCETTCPIGLDSTNTPIFKIWISPMSIESKYPPNTWFDMHDCDLQILYKGFTEKWNDDNWHNTLRDSIFWYVTANNIDKAAGIILAQAALELMSYEYSVNYRKIVTKKDFKSLTAAGKLRIFFNSEDIPLKLSNYSTELSRLINSEKWMDAPEVITAIRNTLVHPNYEKRDLYRCAIYETWNLSLWYIEMSILSLSKYKGKYSNRLTSGRYIGETDDFPLKNNP